MSLIFVKHFVYLSTSYNCYFDTGTNTGVANVTGPDPLTTVPLPNAGDSANEGDPISTFCSDNPDTTKVSTFAHEVTPFFTFSLEADSADCPVIPPGTSVLVINSLDITNEQSTGANDGQVVINATSTVGGIQYSLDNSTWQSSNTFTGLAPGNYIAYVKDSDDTEISQPFSILAYNNPVQNFEDDLPTLAVGSNWSRFNAAFNPIVVFFQRKDFGVTSITRGSGNQILVTLDTTLQFYQSQLAINDQVSFKTAFYDFVGKADGYNVVGGFGVLTVTEVYTFDDTVGYLNIPGIKPGYYTEVQIKYGLDLVHPQYINPRFSPNNKGATRADLAPFLQTLLDFRDTFDYNEVSYPDISQSASYQLQFREVWTGGNGLWFSAPDPLYVTRAAMQLGDYGNGNMAQYVPFLAVDSVDQKAKWLTNFKEPTFWSGLPFELSFIFSDDLLGNPLFLNLVPDCGDAADGLLLNTDDSYIIDEDGGRFIIYNTEIDAISIFTAVGVNRVLVPDLFDCCAEKIKANIYYVLDDVRVYVMQDIYIRLKCPCPEPYIYIKWVNSLGAWDYYYFGFNQFLNANISNDQSVKRFVLNWSSDDTIEDNISKSSIRSLRVGASQINSDDANALQWARKSIKAQMLVNTNPIKWQTVIIKDGSTDIIQSRKKTSDIAFELLLVSDNLQNQ